MAHISEISSGTFTTLARVGSTSRPANAAGWLSEFNVDTGATGVTVPSANISLVGTTLSFRVVGTDLGTPQTGRTYHVAGTGNIAGLYFTASEVQSGASSTGWNVVQTVPAGTAQPPAITGSGAFSFADGNGSVGNIREFPSLGTPANIVNVPVYGQSISSQVGGQADAPTLSFTLNYVPSVHAALDELRRDGTTQAWRVRLAAAEQGARGNSFDIYDDFYFRGSVVSFEITPSLSDSNQATITVNITGDFAGPFSLVGATYGPITIS